MTDKELMQQALDALEDLHRTGDTQVFDMCYAPKLLPALRARLAQPEQEPLAWRNTETGEFSTGGFLRNKLGQWMPLYTSLDWAAIYTAQPQREWQGLTDEEIDWLWRLAFEAKLNNIPRHFARMVEEKLKEKNELL